MASCVSTILATRGMCLYMLTTILVSIAAKYGLKHPFACGLVPFQSLFGSFWKDNWTLGWCGAAASFCSSAGPVKGSMPSGKGS